MTSRPAPPPALFVRLEPTADTPLFLQIYRGIRDATLSGTLAPGGPLPSSRRLASDLGVSRTTVNLAYDQLIAEGYLVARPRSGIAVSPALPGRTTQPAARPKSRQVEPPRLSLRGAAIAASPMPALAALGVPPRPFRSGTPDTHAFPA